jgi:DNA polymerase-3 subunit epsilon
MLGPTQLSSGAFVTVDIETTGCRPGTSSVIEIGAARIERGLITAQFSRLVSPTDSIPAAITHLTGITAEMVAGAPPIGEVMEEFAAFARDAVLVAHNHRFDMSFLDYEAEREWGSPFARPVLDTLTLARRLHPELPRHNLRDLSAFYGVSTVPNHRALPDALATAEVFLCMMPELEHAGMSTAAEAAKLCGIAQQSRLASKLPLATHLPDGPGVYLFRDAEGDVVFVGRAKCLRTRVRNHFYAPDDSDCPSPASRVASISYFPLVSSLDAALLEVRLMDRYIPQFNRNSHPARQPVYLHVDTDAEYPSIKVSRRRLHSGVLIGPLSNEWAATTLADMLAEHHGLRCCRRPVDECIARDCTLRNNNICHDAEAYAAGPEAYAVAVADALAIFGEGGTSLREVLRRMQEHSASAERFEDAARYRDAIRALDRTLASLGIARRAAEHRLSVVVEGDENTIAAIVLVRGWHFSTLRFSREQVCNGRYIPRIEATLARAQRQLTSSRGVSARHLRDTVIVDSYCRQHSPLMVQPDGEADITAERVASAIRRVMRVPRRRHGAASGV